MQWNINKKLIISWMWITEFQQKLINEKTESYNKDGALPQTWSNNCSTCFFIIYCEFDQILFHEDFILIFFSWKCLRFYIKKRRKKIKEILFFIVKNREEKNEKENFH